MEGKLIVISGASGVGKGTVLKKMMEKCPSLAFSVSATTRAPRNGEVDGQHYYFVSRERFEELIRQGAFLEYDNHEGNYYGTLWVQTREKCREHDVLLDIEPNGAKRVKELAPGAQLFFIMPPNMQELERRLRSRNDTSEEQIALRLERAKWEIEQRFWYDHVVVNDEVERCADEILSLI